MHNPNKKLCFLFFIALVLLSEHNCFAMQPQQPQQTVEELQKLLGVAQGNYEKLKSTLDANLQKQKDESEKALKKILKQTKKAQENEKIATDARFEALKEQAKTENHSTATYTFPTAAFPEDMASAQAEVYRAQAKQIDYQNTWKKAGVDFAAETNRHVVAPLLVQGLSPVVTDWRQKYICKTTIEQLQEDTLKANKDRTVLEAEITEQTKQNNNETKKHNDDLAEHQNLTALITQFRGLCDSYNNSTCQEMAEMISAMQRKKIEDAYQKSFGKPYTPKST